MLKKGIYEQIINQKLKNELGTFDTIYEVGTESIDVEEARKMLSSYISQVKWMSFVWRLREEMPAYLVPRANKNII